jgi:hypothetical protein
MIVAVSEDLLNFVRRGLAAGIARADLEAAMLAAGWTVEQARSALSSFADLDFPIPVPRPRPYLSAREGFMYIVMFSTLYLSAYNLGSIVFELIDRVFPDPTIPGSAEWSLRAIRWSVSSLIVAAPVFLYMSWSIGRSIRRDPTKRSSRIRKQLTYVTLLIGGCVLLGDVTTLVYNLLGGELTVRFLLKVATVGLIAGSICAYYLSELRLEEADRSDRHRPVDCRLAGCGSPGTGGPHPRRSTAADRRSGQSLVDAAPPDSGNARRDHPGWSGRAAA